MLEALAEDDASRARALACYAAGNALLQFELAGALLTALVPGPNGKEEERAEQVRPRAAPRKGGAPRRAAPLGP
jgi:hypothetical protein